MRRQWNRTKRAAFAVLIGIGLAWGGWIAGRTAATASTAAQDTSRLDGLTANLKAQDRETRLRAVEELGRGGDERAVAPLAAVLRSDADFLVAAAAAEALGALKSKQGLKPLLDALSNQQAEIRGAAARALGRMGDPLSVGPLIGMLKDKEGFVRAAAAQSLGRLGNTLAANELIPLLSDPETEVRTSAAEALGSVGTAAAVDALLKALTDASAYVRGRAALALAKLGDARAVAPLIDGLKDPDRLVRSAAAEALGRFKDRRAVRPLIDILADRDVFVRQNAAFALGRIGDESAVEPLADLLRDEDARVRGRAVDALGQLAVARSLDPILEALRDADKVVRTTAVQALGNFAESRAVEALLPLLADTDAGLRRRAVESLGKIGDPRAVPGLRGTLTDANPGVRIAGILAYGKLAKEQAVPALLDAFAGDADPQARNAAGFALGSVHSPDGFNGVLKLLGQADAAKLATLRPAADTFLKSYADSTAALDAARTAKDATLRRGALTALDTVLDAPTTAEALISALTDASPDVRRIAVEGLARRKTPKATAGLVAMLTRDGDPTLRARAARALAEVPNPDGATIAALRNALQKDAIPDVRDQAGTALDKIGVARVILPDAGTTKVASVPATGGQSPVKAGQTAQLPPPPREQPATKSESSGKAEPAPKATVKRTEPSAPAASVARNEPPTAKPSVTTSTSPAAAPKPTAGLIAKRETKPIPAPPVPAVPTRAALMAANETAAYDRLLAMLNAEKKFLEGSGQYAGIVDLIGKGLLDPRYARGEADGYRFTLYVSQATGASPAHFFVLATPTAFDETGRRSFFIDPSGIARFRENRETTRLEDVFATWLVGGRQ